MSPVIFDDSAAFRRWLEREHATATEIWVRLRRTASRLQAMTYAEALDQALCFGWIDGVRHPGDDRSYQIRFSPRKPRSIWSKVNLAHYARLEKAGLIAPPGRAAFERRDPARSGLYSFENRHQELPAPFQRRFKAKAKAWSFFQAQPPGYRRTCHHWVLSAKQEATRQRRLDQLIADSAAGRRLAMLARSKSA